MENDQRPAAIGTARGWKLLNALHSAFVKRNASAAHRRWSAHRGAARGFEALRRPSAGARHHSTKSAWRNIGWGMSSSSSYAARAGARIDTIAPTSRTGARMLALRRRSSPHRFRFARRRARTSGPRDGACSRGRPGRRNGGLAVLGRRGDAQGPVRGDR